MQILVAVRHRAGEGHVVFVSKITGRQRFDARHIFQRGMTVGISGRRVRRLQGTTKRRGLIPAESRRLAGRIIAAARTTGRALIATMGDVQRARFGANAAPLGGGGAGAGDLVQPTVSSPEPTPRIKGHDRCHKCAGVPAGRTSRRLADQSLQRLEVGQVAERRGRLAPGKR
jgi:hypothetical protein